MKFSQLDIDPLILKGIEKAGYSECMPVQEQTFPITFNAQDIYVQSETGSGKTAAFMISIFHRFTSDAKLKGKKALIVAPTRELADQISKEAALLGQFLDLKIGVFFGGVGYGKQEKLLAQSVDVIVGTPGRLLDFSDSGKLQLKDVAIFVIDEADRLFDMGFLPDLKKMIRKMPPQAERQTMLFSATLDDRVKHIAGTYMNEPVEINLSPEKITVDNIEQKLYHVGTDEKINLLLGILKRENPGNAIIFTNTKHKAVEISKRLELNGYNCEFLMGDLPQNKRLSIIGRIKSGELRFLIATDVAARGLHVDDLDMVINYDLPEHSENYVHRIGRTARAGKSGKAISLACEHFVYSLESIETLIDMKIPVEWPDDELFADDKSHGVRIRYNTKDERDGRQRERRQPGAHKKRKGGKDAPQQAAKKSSHAVDNTRKAKKGHPQQQQKTGETRKRDSRDFKRPQKTSSLDERLEFYSKKYGDTFKVEKESPGKTSAPKNRKGFAKRLFKFFRLQNK